MRVGVLSVSTVLASLTSCASFKSILLVHHCLFSPWLCFLFPQCHSISPLYVVGGYLPVNPLVVCHIESCHILFQVNFLAPTNGHFVGVYLSSEYNTHTHTNTLHTSVLTFLLTGRVLVPILNVLLGTNACLIYFFVASSHLFSIAFNISVNSLLSSFEKKIHCVRFMQLANRTVVVSSSVLVNLWEKCWAHVTLSFLYFYVFFIWVIFRAKLVWKFHFSLTFFILILRGIPIFISSLSN